MIDIGANLAHESFGHDYPQVLQRAAAAGLTSLILTGSCAASNTAVRALAQQAAPLALFATAGLHPHHAADWNADFAAALADHLPEAVASGECGLDYFRDLAPRDQQRRAFEGQLALAERFQKPLFLHQREAHSDFLAMLREHPSLIRQGAVVHCFTDHLEAMQAYLELGCYIGITGWVCDERRGQDLAQAVRHIPDERLLIETDAPYLLPRNAPKAIRKQHRNEPAFLTYVVTALAAARGQSPEHIAAISVLNARRCFNLPTTA